MRSSALDDLRSDFLKEAQSASKLFADLAKVEQYIAESYKTRALIELIQNADDAGSSRFGIHAFQNGFIACNDGRPFTIQDVEALCRSGSSNKIRGGDTIGYRGIGFKSVVNIAQKVYVLSGDFSFFYEKQSTQNLLHITDDVPLIRIPHPFEVNDHLPFYHDIISLRSNYLYQTFFVFEVLNERILMDELSGFDNGAVLFLNNLDRINFDYHNVKRAIYREALTRNRRVIVKLTEEAEVSEWEILRSEENPISKVALKRFHENIISASPAESVIHSFVPTTEFSGAFIKINGNYSTDPSRKNIDMDELSEKAFDQAIQIIVDTIATILNRDITRKGFFSPFVNITAQMNTRFRSLLFKKLKGYLGEMEFKISQGDQITFSSVRLKPDWLDYETYEKICYGDISSISKELLLEYPDLIIFLKLLDVKTLTLDEIFERFNPSRVEVDGCAEIFSKIIRQFRYDLDSKKIAKIRKLSIFPVGQNYLTANQVKNEKNLDKTFSDYIYSHEDPLDITFFLNKLGIAPKAKRDNGKNKKKSKSNMLHDRSLTVSEEIISKGFKVKPAIQKWRSAEENAAEYLKAIPGIQSVADVTQANLGYDLEILLENGSRLYVEVKSLTSFSDSFKITNNEYSSASHYGRNYYIALVINEDPFQVKLIQDPINTLDFHKKCERWSWFCTEYSEYLEGVAQLLN